MCTPDVSTRAPLDGRYNRIINNVNRIASFMKNGIWIIFNIFKNIIKFEYCRRLKQEEWSGSTQNVSNTIAWNGYLSLLWMAVLYC